METKQSAFMKIAEALAGRYDVIYYVDMINGVYTQFSSGDAYGDVEIREEGNEFFTDAANNAEVIVHPEDRQRVLSILNRDYLITKLDEQKEFITDYRLRIDGRTQHTRMHVIYATDRRHLVISVENIEAEVLKKQEISRALQAANEMARKDELTGVKNKNAYREFQNSLQRNMTKGKAVPFGIVVCDLNDLKQVNDTMGHKTGDDYLIRACRMICKIFSRSPVFRVGGDEFIVILMNRDYTARSILLARFRQQVREHLRNDDGPVMAIGMSVYDPGKDRTVSEIMERADQEMYEDKRMLKLNLEEQDAPPDGESQIIPEGRRQKMDELFEAMQAISGGDHVYICDMKYDYSRWSSDAVKKFGLPGEYMYDAGYLWENHVHPDDREGYHRSIDGVFFGSAKYHDMQYRAQTAAGHYVSCTCRGSVLTDRSGKGEYFIGSIQDHSSYEHTDTTTGLRNQYAFLEDLQDALDRHVFMQIWIVSISRFSEINDVYGYHFGNRILQMMGRYLYSHVEGKGKVYRLDGTKFAVISSSVGEDVIRARYEDLRAHFRDGFYVDDKYIILELNAGLLPVDSFDIDQRTVYGCANYACSVSKYEKHGDLVKFSENMGEDNKRTIEKIQAIRASITQGFKGYFLVYQPVVEARTGRLIGAEALLRWKNKTYGQVPPKEFIQVIEQDSLYPDLGNWILRTAIRDTKRILKTNPGFVIDVNLAYTQIEQAGFRDEVLRILKEEEFPPENLCLEITERCRLLDLELLKNTVAGLRSRGVRIALDDFGTGYASMAILKEIPLDVIKIDRSFVEDIEDSNVDRGVISSFSKVASLYTAKVCVEGVETSGMVEILRNYPIDTFQGYYYSKPLVFRDFLQWESEREKERWN